MATAAGEAVAPEAGLSLGVYSYTAMLLSLTVLTFSSLYTHRDTHTQEEGEGTKRG